MKNVSFILWKKSYRLFDQPNTVESKHRHYLLLWAVRISLPTSASVEGLGTPST